MRNRVGDEDRLVQRENRVLTITSGKARGRLVGGNLTVLTALMGTDYLPDFDGCILFIEDVHEEVYRVDRMLTQLSLAGVLQQVDGLVFGRCTDCDPSVGYGSLTLEEVLADHVAPLGIPAWYGSMIGHIKHYFTVPLGIEAEIDAEAGTIRLLESAVL
jgi:muramoyltetrapeptide carboxypeptidase